ncbi:MAG: hypothetical protein PHI98_03515 [Eubacteriales bacterium]|nr:hypothetical protein [Eubacteriales bacterium]
MKGLKIGAIVMASLLVVMLLMLSYLFLTAEVTVTNISSQGIPASDQQASFDSMKAALDQETFIGTVYQKPLEWKEASDYVFLNYSVTVHNGCLVPIDMIQVQVVPQPSDIAQLGDLAVHSLAAKTDGSIQAMILSPKDTHPVREIIVTYYVWGVSFQIKALSGN